MECRQCRDGEVKWRYKSVLFECTSKNLIVYIVFKDAHSIHPTIQNMDGYSFFAIFDGHAGNLVATYRLQLSCTIYDTFVIHITLIIYIAVINC